MNWMNLPEEYRKGKFAILPIAYEKDVTYGKGTSKGPEEIIAASKHLEYYDCELNCEPFIEGISLLDSVTGNTAEEMIDNVSNVISKNKNKFVISLGGDHSVTIGTVKGMEEVHDDFSVIVLDAHSDLRDSWNGSSLNHACVSKQISKKHSLALIGVRAMDVDEMKFVKSNGDVHLIQSYNYSLDKVKEILPKLKDKIYISIDVDVFDLSFIRNTGTPEPGGFTWNQVIEILELIFSCKEVIGADVVEFAPVDNFRSEAYSLAKLVYKLMGLKF